MTRTKYPLSRLKRLREYELEEAAAILKKITEEANLLQDLILGCNESISRISRDMARREEETGSVFPELRRNAALCIRAQEMERHEHEQQLAHVEVKREAAYGRLLESKQATKMIDRHEDRYKSAIFAAEVRRCGNEADDLYLARVGAKS